MAIFHAADENARSLSVHITRELQKCCTTSSLKNLIAAPAVYEIDGLAKTPLVKCFIATTKNLVLRFVCKREPAKSIEYVSNISTTRCLY